VSNRAVSFVTLELVACVLVFQPSRARADTVPTINITSATGSACWGRNCLPQSGTNPYEFATFSGPNFSVGFSSFGTSQYDFSARAGDVVPGSYFDGPIDFQLPGESFFGNISVTLSGHTDSAPFDPPVIAISNSTNVTVPSGYGTVELPAVLTDSGPVCVGGFVQSGEFFCSGPPPAVPDIVANVNINVPGFVTIRFSPAGVPIYSSGSEYYMATFTPVPEPSTAWMLVFGLAIAAGYASARFRFSIASSISAVFL